MNISKKTVTRADGDVSLLPPYLETGMLLHEAIIS